MWVWEHAIYFLCGDFWNISKSSRIGHCYYSDWGVPPKSKEGELKGLLLERSFRRSNMMLAQLHLYPPPVAPSTEAYKVEGWVRKHW